MFNVKGCDPQNAQIYTCEKLKQGLRLHGWCCKVSQISTCGYLYLEIINPRVNTENDHLEEKEDGESTGEN